MLCSLYYEKYKLKLINLLYYYTGACVAASILSLPLQSYIAYIKIVNKYLLTLSGLNVIIFGALLHRIIFITKY